jgi:acyl-CoA synthetase (AMP-forming)/AMP-acid ligase II
MNMAMPHNLAAPLNCGKRLLPVLVDEIAATDPERTFVSIPQSSDLADGFTNISYCRFAKAVNRCAWWIRKELGGHTEQKTVLYLGPLDLRYLIIILATAKAGHVVSLECLTEASVRKSDYLWPGILQLSP